MNQFGQSSHSTFQFSAIDTTDIFIVYLCPDFKNILVMKKICFVVLISVVSFMATAQDVILKNNGKEIKVNVIEANNELIKFHVFNENDKLPCNIKQQLKQARKQNQPTDNMVFSLPKKEVFMIQYENGKNDIYKDKVGDRTVKNILNFIDVNDNAEAYKMYRSGYKRYSLSRGLVGAGGGLLVFGSIAMLVSATDGKKDNTNLGASGIYMGAGCAFLAAGLPLYFSAKKKMNQAFDMYVQSIKTAQSNYHMDFGLTQNGIGLQMKF